MATSEYLATLDIKRYFFSTYSQASVSLFATQFNADWASVLGGTVAVTATTAAPLVALIIINANLVLTVNPGDFVGFNYGNWQVVQASKMSGLSFTASTV
jgi:hypothetical protein